MADICNYRLDEILKRLKVILDEVRKLEFHDRVAVINAMRQEIAEISPFDDPVDCVKWVQGDNVIANDYNPNRVAPPEMQLLAISILEDGFTQPIVSYIEEEVDNVEAIYTVVDGFHRNRVGKEEQAVKERLHGYLPVVTISKPLSERMASTIRHNRARGTHAIQPMSKVVEELYFMGWSDKRIAEQLGMEKDEVLRLKQFVGLGSLFTDREFSYSWS